MATRWLSHIEREHGRVRAALMGLFLLACAGTSVELVLLEHVESWEQWLPLAALGVALVTGGAAVVRPGRGTLRLFRAVALALVVTGVAGLYLHVRGNTAFELELDPSQERMALVWHVLTGATPILAPATMAWLGALGWIFTYRHPALSADAERGPTPHHRTKETTA